MERGVRVPPRMKTPQGRDGGEAGATTSDACGSSPGLLTLGVSLNSASSSVTLSKPPPSLHFGFLLSSEDHCDPLPPMHTAIPRPTYMLPLLGSCSQQDVGP